MYSNAPRSAKGGKGISSVPATPAPPQPAKHDGSPTSTVATGHAASGGGGIDALNEAVEIIRTDMALIGKAFGVNVSSSSTVPLPNFCKGSSVGGSGGGAGDFMQSQKASRPLPALSLSTAEASLASSRRLVEEAAGFISDAYTGNSSGKTDKETNKATTAAARRRPSFDNNNSSSTNNNQHGTAIGSSRRVNAAGSPETDDGEEGKNGDALSFSEPRSQQQLRVPVASQHFLLPQSNANAFFGTESDADAAATSDPAAQAYVAGRPPIHSLLPYAMFRKFDPSQPSLPVRRRARPKVLIADGNLIHLIASKIAFDKCFEVVDVCSDGRQVLGLLQANVYDAVFLAAEMGELDGPETAEAIRFVEDTAGAAFRTLLVGMLTKPQAASERLFDRCFLSGMDRFILKPLVHHVHLVQQTISSVSVSEGFRRAVLEKRWFSNRGHLLALLHHGNNGSSKASAKGVPNEGEESNEETDATVDAACDAADARAERALAAADAAETAERIADLIAADEPSLLAEAAVTTLIPDRGERKAVEALLARQRHEELQRMNALILQMGDVITDLQYDVSVLEAENKALKESQGGEQLLLLQARTAELEEALEAAKKEAAVQRERAQRREIDIRQLLDSGARNERHVAVAVAHAKRHRLRLERQENSNMAMLDLLSGQSWYNYYGSVHNREAEARGPTAAVAVPSTSAVAGRRSTMVMMMPRPSVPAVLPSFATDVTASWFRAPLTKLLATVQNSGAAVLTHAYDARNDLCRRANAILEQRQQRRIGGGGMFASSSPSASPPLSFGAGGGGGGSNAHNNANNNGGDESLLSGIVIASMTVLTREEDNAVQAMSREVEQCVANLLIREHFLFEAIAAEDPKTIRAEIGLIRSFIAEQRKRRLASSAACQTEPFEWSRDVLGPSDVAARIAAGADVFNYKIAYGQQRDADAGSAASFGVDNKRKSNAVNKQAIGSSDAPPSAAAASALSSAKTSLTHISNPAPLRGLIVDTVPATGRVVPTYLTKGHLRSRWAKVKRAVEGRRTVAARLLPAGVVDEEEEAQIAELLAMAEEERVAKERRARTQIGGGADLTISSADGDSNSTAAAEGTAKSGEPAAATTSSDPAAAAEANLYGDIDGTSALAPDTASFAGAAFLAGAGGVSRDGKVKSRIIAEGVLIGDDDLSSDTCSDSVGGSEGAADAELFSHYFDDGVADDEEDGDEEDANGQVFDGHRRESSSGGRNRNKSVATSLGDGGGIGAADTVASDDGNDEDDNDDEDDDVYDSSEGSADGDAGGDSNPLSIDEDSAAANSHRKPSTSSSATARRSTSASLADGGGSVSASNAKRRRSSSKPRKASGATKATKAKKKKGSDSPTPISSGSRSSTPPPATILSLPPPPARASTAAGATNALLSSPSSPIAVLRPSVGGAAADAALLAWRAERQHRRERRRALRAAKERRHAGRLAMLGHSDTLRALTAALLPMAQTEKYVHRTDRVHRFLRCFDAIASIERRRNAEVAAAVVSLFEATYRAVGLVDASLPLSPPLKSISSGKGKGKSGGSIEDVTNSNTFIGGEFRPLIAFAKTITTVAPPIATASQQTEDSAAASATATASADAAVCTSALPIALPPSVESAAVEAALVDAYNRQVVSAYLRDMFVAQQLRAQQFQQQQRAERERERAESSAAAGPGGGSEGHGEISIDGGFASLESEGHHTHFPPLTAATTASKSSNQPFAVAAPLANTGKTKKKKNDASKAGGGAHLSSAAALLSMTTAATPAEHAAAVAAFAHLQPTPKEQKALQMALEEGIEDGSIVLPTVANAAELEAALRSAVGPAPSLPTDRHAAVAAVAALRAAAAGGTAVVSVGGVEEGSVEGQRSAEVSVDTNTIASAVLNDPTGAAEEYDSSRPWRQGNGKNKRGGAAAAAAAVFLGPKLTKKRTAAAAEALLGDGVAAASIVDIAKSLVPTVQKCIAKANLLAAALAAVTTAAVADAEAAAERTSPHHSHSGQPSTDVNSSGGGGFFLTEAPTAATASSGAAAAASAVAKKSPNAPSGSKKDPLLGLANKSKAASTTSAPLQKPQSAAEAAQQQMQTAFRERGVFERRLNALLDEAVEDVGVSAGHPPPSGSREGFQGNSVPIVSADGSVSDLGAFGGDVGNLISQVFCGVFGQAQSTTGPTANSASAIDDARSRPMPTTNAELIGSLANIIDTFAASPPRLNRGSNNNAGAVPSSPPLLSAGPSSSLSLHAHHAGPTSGSSTNAGAANALTPSVASMHDYAATKTLAALLRASVAKRNVVTDSDDAIVDGVKGSGASFKDDRPMISLSMGEIGLVKSHLAAAASSAAVGNNANNSNKKSGSFSSAVAAALSSPLLPATTTASASASANPSFSGGSTATATAAARAGGAAGAGEWISLAAVAHMFQTEMADIRVTETRGGGAALTSAAAVVPALSITSPPATSEHSSNSGNAAATAEGATTASAEATTTVPQPSSTSTTADRLFAADATDVILHIPVSHRMLEALMRKAAADADDGSAADDSDDDDGGASEGDGEVGSVSNGSIALSEGQLGATTGSSNGIARVNSIGAASVQTAATATSLGLGGGATKGGKKKSTSKKKKGGGGQRQKEPKSSGGGVVTDVLLEKLTAILIRIAAAGTSQQQQQQQPIASGSTSGASSPAHLILSTPNVAAHAADDAVATETTALALLPSSSSPPPEAAAAATSSSAAPVLTAGHQRLLHAVLAAQHDIIATYAKEDTVRDRHHRLEALRAAPAGTVLDMDGVFKAHGGTATSGTTQIATVRSGGNNNRAATGKAASANAVPAVIGNAATRRAALAAATAAANAAALLDPSVPPTHRKLYYKHPLSDGSFELLEILVPSLTDAEEAAVRRAGGTDAPALLLLSNNTNSASNAGSPNAGSVSANVAAKSPSTISAKASKASAGTVVTRRRTVREKGTCTSDDSPFAAGGVPIGNAAGYEAFDLVTKAQRHRRRVLMQQRFRADAPKDFAAWHSRRTALLKEFVELCRARQEQLFGKAFGDNDDYEENNAHSNGDGYGRGGRSNNTANASTASDADGFSHKDLHAALSIAFAQQQAEAELRRLTVPPAADMRRAFLTAPTVHTYQLGETPEELLGAFGAVPTAAEAVAPDVAAALMGLGLGLGGQTPAMGTLQIDPYHKVGMASASTTPGLGSLSPPTPLPTSGANSPRNAGGFGAPNIGGFPSLNSTSSGGGGGGGGVSFDLRLFPRPPLEMLRGILACPPTAAGSGGAALLPANLNSSSLATGAASYGATVFESRKLPLGAYVRSSTPPPPSSPTATTSGPTDPAALVAARAVTVDPSGLYGDEGLSFATSLAERRAQRDARRKAKADAVHSAAFAQAMALHAANTAKSKGGSSALAAEVEAYLSGGGGGGPAGVSVVNTGQQTIILPPSAASASSALPPMPPLMAGHELTLSVPLIPLLRAANACATNPRAALAAITGVRYPSQHLPYPTSAEAEELLVAAARLWRWLCALGQLALEPPTMPLTPFQSKQVHMAVATAVSGLAGKGEEDGDDDDASSGGDSDVGVGNTSGANAASPATRPAKGWYYSAHGVRPGTPDTEEQRQPSNTNAAGGRKRPPRLVPSYEHVTIPPQAMVVHELTPAEVRQFAVGGGANGPIPQSLSTLTAKKNLALYLASLYPGVSPAAIVHYNTGGRNPFHSYHDVMVPVGAAPTTATNSGGASSRVSAPPAPAPAASFLAPYYTSDAFAEIQRRRAEARAAAGSAGLSNAFAGRYPDGSSNVLNSVFMASHHMTPLGSAAVSPQPSILQQQQQQQQQAPVAAIGGNKRGAPLQQQQQQNGAPSVVGTQITAPSAAGKLTTDVNAGAGGGDEDQLCFTETTGIFIRIPVQDREHFLARVLWAADAVRARHERLLTQCINEKRGLHPEAAAWLSKAVRIALGHTRAVVSCLSRAQKLFYDDSGFGGLLGGAGLSFYYHPETARAQRVRREKIEARLALAAPAVRRRYAKEKRLQRLRDGPYDLGGASSNYLLLDDEELARRVEEEGGAGKSADLDLWDDPSKLFGDDVDGADDDDGTLSDLLNSSSSSSSDSDNDASRRSGNNKKKRGSSKKGGGNGSSRKSASVAAGSDKKAKASSSIGGSSSVAAAKRKSQKSVSGLDVAADGIGRRRTARLSIDSAAATPTTADGGASQRTRNSTVHIRSPSSSTAADSPAYSDSHTPSAAERAAMIAARLAQDSGRAPLPSDSDADHAADHHHQIEEEEDAKSPDQIHRRRLAAQQAARAAMVGGAINGNNAKPFAGASIGTVLSVGAAAATVSGSSNSALRGAMLTGGGGGGAAPQRRANGRLQGLFAGSGGAAGGQRGSGLSTGADAMAPIAGVGVGASSQQQQRTRSAGPSAEDGYDYAQQQRIAAQRSRMQQQQQQAAANKKKEGLQGGDQQPANNGGTTNLPAPLTAADLLSFAPTSPTTVGASENNPTTISSNNNARKNSEAIHNINSISYRDHLKQSVIDRARGGAADGTDDLFDDAEEEALRVASPRHQTAAGVSAGAMLSPKKPLAPLSPPPSQQQQPSMSLQGGAIGGLKRTSAIAAAAHHSSPDHQNQSGGAQRKNSLLLFANAFGGDASPNNNARGASPLVVHGMRRRPHEGGTLARGRAALGGIGSDAHPAFSSASAPPSSSDAASAPPTSFSSASPYRFLKAEAGSNIVLLGGLSVPRRPLNTSAENGNTTDGNGNGANAISIPTASQHSSPSAPLGSLGEDTSSPFGMMGMGFGSASSPFARQQMLLRGAKEAAAASAATNAPQADASLAITNSNTPTASSPSHSSPVPLYRRPLFGRPNMPSTATVHNNSGGALGVSSALAILPPSMGHGYSASSPLAGVGGGSGAVSYTRRGEPTPLTVAVSDATPPTDSASSTHHRAHYNTLRPRQQPQRAREGTGGQAQSGAGAAVAVDGYEEAIFQASIGGGGVGAAVPDVATASLIVRPATIASGGGQQPADLSPPARRQSLTPRQTRRRVSNALNADAADTSEANSEGEGGEGSAPTTAKAPAPEVVNSGFGAMRHQTVLRQQQQRGGGGSPPPASLSVGGAGTGPSSAPVGHRRQQSPPKWAPPSSPQELPILLRNHAARERERGTAVGGGGASASSALTQKSQQQQQQHIASVANTANLRIGRPSLFVPQSSQSPPQGGSLATKNAVPSATFTALAGGGLSPLHIAGASPTGAALDSLVVSSVAIPAGGSTDVFAGSIRRQPTPPPQQGKDAADGGGAGLASSLLGRSASAASAAMMAASASSNGGGVTAASANAAVSPSPMAASVTTTTRRGQLLSDSVVRGGPHNSSTGDLSRGGGGLMVAASSAPPNGAASTAADAGSDGQQGDDDKSPPLSPTLTPFASSMRWAASGAGLQQSVRSAGDAVPPPSSSASPAAPLSVQSARRPQQPSASAVTTAPATARGSQATAAAAAAGEAPTNPLGGGANGPLGVAVRSTVPSSAVGQQQQQQQQQAPPFGQQLYSSPIERLNSDGDSAPTSGYGGAAIIGSSSSSSNGRGGVAIEVGLRGRSDSATTQSPSAAALLPRIGPAPSPSPAPSSASPRGGGPMATTHRGGGAPPAAVVTTTRRRTLEISADGSDGGGVGALGPLPPISPRGAGVPQQQQRRPTMTGTASRSGTATPPPPPFSARPVPSPPPPDQQQQRNAQQMMASSVSFGPRPPLQQQRGGEERVSSSPSTLGGGGGATSSPRRPSLQQQRIGGGSSSSSTSSSLPPSLAFHRDKK